MYSDNHIGNFRALGLKSDKTINVQLFYFRIIMKVYLSG